MLSIISYVRKNYIPQDTQAQKDYKLYNTAFKGYITSAESLIKQGAFVNCKTEEGFAPLYAAAQNGHIDVVKLLLDKGANIIEENGKCKNTALQIAIRNKHEDIIKLLFDRLEEYNIQLLNSSLSGDTDIIRELLEKGASANYKTAEGFTPLYAAAQNGHIDVVKLLLDNGANINETNGGAKSTALHKASDKGFIDIVRLLIDKSADVMIRSADGYTALDLAQKLNHNDVASIIREKINIKNPIVYNTKTSKPKKSITEKITSGKSLFRNISAAAGGFAGAAAGTSLAAAIGTTALTIGTYSLALSSPLLTIGGVTYLTVETIATALTTTAGGWITSKVAKAVTYDSDDELEDAESKTLFESVGESALSSASGGFTLLAYDWAYDKVREKLYKNTGTEIVKHTTRHMLEKSGKEIARRTAHGMIGNTTVVLAREAVVRSGCRVM